LNDWLFDYNNKYGGIAVDKFVLQDPESGVEKQKQKKKKMADGKAVV
jgi:hypothetical protein